MQLVSEPALDHQLIQERKSISHQHLEENLPKPDTKFFPTPEPTLNLITF